jgi:hypothetical protein
LSNKKINFRFKNAPNCPVREIKWNWIDKFEPFKGISKLSVSK